eukprot:8457665-Alexandrium_andersonii.AAC.1
MPCCPPTLPWKGIFDLGLASGSSWCGARLKCTPYVPDARARACLHALVWPRPSHPSGARACRGRV